MFTVCLLYTSRYVNDKQITDHYAIVPTGQGISSFSSLKEQTKRVYETIARRFLSIFYPPAIYQKAAVVTAIQGEKFFSNVRILESEGYLKVLGGAQDVYKRQGEILWHSYGADVSQKKQIS